MAARFTNKLFFEFLFEDVRGGSEVFRFLKRGEHWPTSDNDNRLKRSARITSFRDCSYSIGIRGEFVPDDFKLTDRTGQFGLDEFMDRACALLCLTFLANSSHISNSGNVDYKIVGYKSVEGAITSQELVSILAPIRKIYEWAYGSGGGVDRIGLIRNFISLYVDDLKDISDQPSFWNAVHSNYQIYLKGNVASYLEVKSKIAELLVESTLRTHSIADTLAESVKSSVFIVLTFVLSVVVVNGFKDTSASVVFTLPYFLVLAAVSGVLTLWILGMCRAAMKRFDNSAKTVEDIIKSGYSKIILPNEISESVDPINKKNRKYLSRQILFSLFLWVGLVIVLLLSFQVGRHLLVPAANEHKGAVFISSLWLNRVSHAFLLL
ncbi:hypothetical protein [Xanthomonas vesicatoria]|uniref:hypothetical protein n=1 Tax=Xanthomonas vesicatoria TaxID=56460 RepID=UPI001E37D040|nr:hypothetical protein [Xanthomonas vesicatoria]MCC8616398.1 hypothetical protein [Xanthomonas vesicatoria]MCC8629782.1 hypothetical protein [Xanthomonas vesicatoria]